MAGKALYQDDIHAWALDQAEALRNLGLKADPGVGGLDLPHLIEEIEGICLSARRELRNHLGMALRLCLVAAENPDGVPLRLLRSKIQEELYAAQDSYTPSMSAHIDMDEIWALAQKRARVRDGIVSAFSRPQCPVTLAEILAEDLRSEALIVVIAQGMGQDAEQPGP